MFTNNNKVATWERIIGVSLAIFLHNVHQVVFVPVQPSAQLLARTARVLYTVVQSQKVVTPYLKS